MENHYLWKHRAKTLMKSAERIVMQRPVIAQKIAGKYAKKCVYGGKTILRNRENMRVIIDNESSPRELLSKSLNIGGRKLASQGKRINDVRSKYLPRMADIFVLAAKKLNGRFFRLTTLTMMALKCVEKAYTPATERAFISGYEKTISPTVFRFYA